MYGKSTENVFSFPVLALVDAVGAIPPPCFGFVFARYPMAIQIDGGKRFGFDHAYDFYDKLEWEYEQVMKAGFATGREISYHFMNFAITGWHMADWIYPHLPEEFALNFTKKSDFARWAKQQCRALAACHMIANASKHFEIDKDNEPTIELVAMPGWDAAHNDVPMRNMIAISIDGEIHGLDRFASNVISFWVNFLDSQGLLADGGIQWPGHGGADTL